VQARSEEVIWRNIDGQVLILDLKSSTYLRSNGTGANLWEQLQRERTRDNLVSHLVAAYSVDPTTASRDVDDFLEMLDDADLLAR
jgi:hypothetical protein